MKTLTCGLVLLCAVAVAEAAPTKEERIHDLLYELRCLVCQNQSLADSDAELAGDLRNRVRELVESGLTDEEVVEHLRQRYGDFILYRPLFQANTVVLWVGPFVVLGLFLILLLRRIRHQRRHAAVMLSDSDHQRVKEILHREND